MGLSPGPTPYNERLELRRIFGWRHNVVKPRGESSVRDRVDVRASMNLEKLNKSNLMA